MTSRAVRKAGWAAFDGWSAPRVSLTWDGFDAWEPAFHKLVEESGRRVGEELQKWDERLEDIGGDPSRQSWKEFRPLRLSREEDWSDWLAHLLERSETGRFARRLLGDAVRESDRVTKAEREKKAGDSRADIVLDLEDGAWLHVEVKVGDRNLAKTLATASALKSTRGPESGPLP